MSSVQLSPTVLVPRLVTGVLEVDENPSKEQWTWRCEHQSSVKYQNVSWRDSRDEGEPVDPTEVLNCLAQKREIETINPVAWMIENPRYVVEKQMAPEGDLRSDRTDSTYPESGSRRHWCHCLVDCFNE